MFERAEVGHAVDDATFDREEEALRAALLEAELDLADAASCPVVVLIEGMDAAGKGETINRLHKWLDPRHIRTRSLGEPRSEERERPPLWRYWRALPPKGRIGVFVNAWHHELILPRAEGDLKRSALDRRLAEVAAFERLLVDEGAILVKFWLHLSEGAQRKRLKRLESNPETSWRVTKTDWQHHRIYGRLRSAAEYALTRTNTAAAPWSIVEAADANYRHLTIGQTLLQAIRQRLDQGTAGPVHPAHLLPAVPATAGHGALDRLDLSRTLDKADYEDQLAAWQGQLSRLSRHRRFRRLAVVAAFEGPDAGGKGGAIRRVTAALDPRQYEIVRIAAPTAEEKAYPYLWRFWQHVPGRGELVLFDRSWYGRVLVERVEGFAAEAEWQRAYGEINDFEQQLSRHNILVVKFWIAISQEEQLARFEAREDTPYKRYKITPDDWRNREKWDLYQVAASDMIDRTSTEAAPWTLVAGNDKRHVRIQVLRTLCRRIEAAIG